MADREGGLTLPVPVPIVAGGARAYSVGDPALGLIASFVAAALEGDVGEAWRALQPGLQALPDRGTGGAARLSGPVRSILLEDPRLGRGFDEADAPILFAYRARDDRSRDQPFTDDDLRRLSLVMLELWWGPGSRELEIQRDNLTNAVSASVSAAVYLGRHANWILDSDRRQPESLIVPRTISTSQDLVLDASQFDGPLKGQPLSPPRCLLFNTVPAAGAYRLNRPIVIEGKDKKGRDWSEDFYLTNADGGEASPSLWQWSALTRITFPRQLLNTNQISVGIWDIPDLRLGSLIQRVTGISQMRVTNPGESKTVMVRPIKTSGEPPFPLELYEMVVSVQEDLLLDPSVHAEPTSNGLAIYAIPNGALFSTYATAFMPAP